MDGAEAAFAECGGAGGHRDEESPGRPGGGAEGRARPLASTDPELGLAVALEGQQGLRQFLPVYPGGHHRQDDVTPSMSIRAGACASARKACRVSSADLPCAGPAECQVLRAAADAFHRERPGPAARPRPRPGQQPRQRPRMFAAVPRRRRGGRAEVRIRGSAPAVSWWADLRPCTSPMVAAGGAPQKLRDGYVDNGPAGSAVSRGKTGRSGP